MKYKMTTDLQGSFDATPYQEAGINENNELDRVEYGQSDKGNEFLAFYFKDASGAVVSKTEWPATMPESLAQLTPEEYEQDTSEEKKIYESRRINQMARVKHICVDSGFVTNDAFIFEAETFKEFSENVIDALGDNYKGKKVRLKVVYDRNNFTSLPSYTRYVWIEPMEIPKDESKIRILGIDKMHRIQADKEENTPNPLGLATSGEGSNDLPF